MAAAEKEECPVPKSKPELTKIATLTFDWLDCSDVAQANTVDCTQIDTEDLSISSFDMGHLSNGKAAVEDNSLTTAQASVAGTVDTKAEPPPATTAVQGAKTLVPVDVDADDLASMEDSIYTSSSFSSSSSSSSSSS